MRAELTPVSIPNPHPLGIVMFVGRAQIGTVGAVEQKRILRGSCAPVKAVQDGDVMVTLARNITSEFVYSAIVFS